MENSRRTAWLVVWKGRFIYIQLAILAAVVWVMWPFRSTITLPNPPDPPYTPEPPDRQGLLVLGSETLASGTQAALRAIVYDPDDGKPIPDADIRVFLSRHGSPPADQPVFEGKTDRFGTLPLVLNVPEADGQWPLTVEAEGSVGMQQVSYPVQVQRSLDLDLVTDQTLYNPGETIHVRLLALNQATTLPVPALPFTFTVNDARGNPICAVSAATSEYGLAVVACELADLVNEGTYHIQAVAKSGLSIQHAVLVKTHQSPHPETAEPAVQDAGQAPAAAQPIRITAEAESGMLEQMLENIVYLRTLYPDGRPAICRLVLDTPAGRVETQTLADGLAEWRYRPTSEQPVTLTITATDAAGQQVQSRSFLAVEPGTDHLLLRPSRLSYHISETMRVEIFSPNNIQNVYLDVLKLGQPVAVYAASITDGYAVLDVPLSNLVQGELALRAYYLDSSGRLVADVRTVLIQPGDELRMSVQAEPGVYAHGEAVSVSIQIRDAQGQDAPGVLAAAAFKTMPFDAEPSFSQPDNLYTASSAVALHRAEIISKPRPAPADVQKQFEQAAAARTARRQAFYALIERTIWALVGLTVLGWLTILIGGWHVRWLTWRLAVRALLSSVVALPLVLGGGALLASLSSQIFGPGALIVLDICWLGALLALLAHGYERRDGIAQVWLALIVGWLAVGRGIHEVVSQGGWPDVRWAVIGALALVAILLALYIWSLGLMQSISKTMALLPLFLLVLCAVSAIGAVGGVDRSAAIAPLSTTPLPQAEASATATVVAPLARTPITASLAAPAASALSMPGISQPQFQETTWWDPSLLTDAQGKLTIVLQPNSSQPFLAQNAGDKASHDWQLSFFASTRRGETASEQVQVSVIRPLSIEPKLPRYLTIGDELDIPAVVDNALEISQTAHITATQASWFRVRTRGADAQRINIAPLSQTLVMVPIQVREWGMQTLTMTIGNDDGGSHRQSLHTIASQASVLPAGVPTARTYNRQTGETDTYKIRIPWGVIQGTDRIAVKVYPTWASILAEGLASALSSVELPPWYTPKVAFPLPIISPTQVSTSMVYPQAFDGRSLRQIAAETQNLRLLQTYLEQSDRLSPEMQSQIERKIRLNDQRLLTFEANDGGFLLLGNGPADLMQTASALLALSPASQEARERTARWLWQKQATDGTWSMSDLPPGWGRQAHPELAVTACVTWALVDAGFADAPEVQLAVKRLIRSLDQAQDPYTLALIVHALSARSAAAVNFTDNGNEGTSLAMALAEASARLGKMAQVQAGNPAVGGTAIWRSTLPTLSGAVDDDADVERTALATWALIRGQSDPALLANCELCHQGLASLANSRDPFGAWGSVETTGYALHAVAAAQTMPLPVQPAAVRVSIRPLRSDEERASPTVAIPSPEQPAGMPVLFYLDAPAKGYNDVWIEVTGGPLFYQLITEYVLSWDQAPPPEEEPLSLALSYDRTSLAVGETVTATVGVMLNRPGTAPLVELALGLPPGLEPIIEDWEDLVRQGLIARYERHDGQMWVYLVGLSAEKPGNFRYRLQGKMVSSARTQPTWALDMADPQQPAFLEPVQFVVRQAD